MSDHQAVMEILTSGGDDNIPRLTPLAVDIALWHRKEMDAEKSAMRNTILMLINQSLENGHPAKKILTLLENALAGEELDYQDNRKKEA